MKGVKAPAQDGEFPLKLTKRGCFVADQANGHVVGSSGSPGKVFNFVAKGAELICSATEGVCTLFLSLVPRD